MNSILKRCAQIVSACLLAVTIGCSKPSDAPFVVPARGTVTQAGKPLAQATVALYPVSGADKSTLIRAETGEDGKFELVSYSPPNYSGQMGAPPGEYIVIVTPAAKPPDPTDEKPKPNEPNPPKNSFSDPATSKFRAKIGSSVTDIPPIELP